MENINTKSTQKKRIKPDWLKIKVPFGKEYSDLKKITKEHKLHTICESGKCPNMAECWGAGTATFMILGNICTRSCTFCNVITGRPTKLDLEEPKRVAQSVLLMNVKHCVITSVNRDELKDKGSSVWADTIRKIKKASPTTTLEVLIPDFKADWEALARVCNEKPEIVSHNMETVEELYKFVRPQAKYYRSLEQIKRTKEFGIRTKSGIMLGLGETKEQVLKAMDDLREHDCDVLTLGQYLQPTKRHIAVKEYIHPDLFAEYKEIGLKKGFRFVESGPMVRSSYHAEKHIL